MKVKILFLIQFLILLSFSQQTWNVEAGMYYYSPSNLVINEGDIVVWTNAGGCHDVNGLTNTITGQPFNNPESFSSDVVCDTGLEIFTYTFNTPGNYNYDCTVYGHASSGMVATITVNEVGCVDDDDTAAELASQWNPSFDGGCEEAVTYFINSGYSCETDLTVLGLSGTIADMCQCTCSEDEGCLNNDSIIDGAFSTLSTCDETINYLVQNYGYSEYDACQWNGDMGSGSLFGGLMIYEFCECSCEDIDDVSTTVLDIIINSDDHNILETAVIAAELDDDLNSDGPFTVFAPTDAAFGALPEGTLETLLENPTGDLANILLHHVYAGNALSTDLSDGMMIPTLLGTSLNVSIEMSGAVMIENSMVTVANMEADNGIVHVINAVLIPEDEDCQNDDNQIEDIFGSMFISDCSSLINYLIDNYGYSEDQACSWNGSPMFDLGGSIISELCPCSCETSSNTNIIEYNEKNNIVMIIDLLGKKLNKVPLNKPTLIIYNDGSVQKTLLTN